MMWMSSENLMDKIVWIGRFGFISFEFFEVLKKPFKSF